MSEGARLDAERRKGQEKGGATLPVDNLTGRQEELDASWRRGQGGREVKGELPATGVLGKITVGAKVNFKGTEYTVVELPNESNDGKYKLKGGKPGGLIYIMTPEKLVKELTELEKEKEPTPPEAPEPPASAKTAASFAPPAALAEPPPEPPPATPEPVKDELETIIFNREEIAEEISKNLEPVLRENGAELETPLRISPEKGGSALKIEVHIVKPVMFLGDYHLSVYATVGNDQSTVRLEDHHYGGDDTAIAKARGVIDPKIQQLVPVLTAFIEKKNKNKKLKGLRIENGELKATFAPEVAPPPTAPPTDIPPRPLETVTPLSQEPSWMRPRDTSETPPSQEPTETDKKAKVIATLKETIANAQKIIEKNRREDEQDDALIEEMRRRLAEIRQRKPEASAPKEVEPETLEEVARRIAELDAEIGSLSKEIEEKLREIDSIGPLRIIKSGKASKELDELILAKDKKYEERRRLYKKREELYEKENERMAQAMAQAREQEERERVEARERKERERKETLERDRERNPFKWFLIDKMRDEAFYCICGKAKGSATLEDIDHVFGESGREVRFLTWKKIIPGMRDTFCFSSNGFTLQLLNKEEVIGEEDGKKVIMGYSPNAKYRLVTPEWTASGTEYNYDQGRLLLEQEARRHQQEQLALFERQKGGN